MSAHLWQQTRRYQREIGALRSAHLQPCRLLRLEHQPTNNLLHTISTLSTHSLKGWGTKVWGTETARAHLK
jgi:hypothetical protein